MRLPRPEPDHLSLYHLEERLDSRVVIAVALAAHRHLESALVQKPLTIMGAALSFGVRIMDTSFRWLPQRNSYLQCADRQIAFHAVANRPADHPT